MENLNFNNEKVIQMWDSIFIWGRKTGERTCCKTPALLINVHLKDYFCSNECFDEYYKEKLN